MIHYVNGLSDFEEVFNGDIIKYRIDLKKKDVIKAIGIISHNPIVAKKAVETGYIDFLMFSVNVAYDMQPPDEDVEQFCNPENYKNQLINTDKDKRFTSFAKEKMWLPML